MSHIPSYLWLSRHSVFYFRIVVPDVIRPLFPKREIRRSLHTRCKREALIRGRELLAQIQHLFTQAFQGTSPSVESLRGSWESGGKRLASWASWLRSDSVVNVPGLPEHRNNVIPVISPMLLQMPGSASAASEPSKGFMEVVDEHIAAQEREGVSKKALDDKRAVALLLARIVGDKPINTVTRKDAHQFRETALKLPPRLYQFPEMPLEEIIAQARSTISVTTFNNYVKNLTTFFSYAVREGYCARNPFDGMRVKQRGKVSEERSIFTSSDLAKLFGSDKYARKDSPRPHQYWLPLMGLYTGARLNELCQLYLDDIVVVNGLDCIHIRASRGDQRLKTVSSERLIPIHSQLIKLGFLEYVKAQRAFGSQRVFPELSCHKKHGYSAVPSKWFARLRNQLGFGSEQLKKDFHSFRHTFANDLKQKAVMESLVGGILGHQSEGITFGRYGKDFRPEVLAPVVELIKFKFAPI